MTALIIQEPMDVSGSLTFTLVQRPYWMDSLTFKKIVGMINTKSVPQRSEFVTGIIDPRGKIIPFDSGEEFKNYPARLKNTLPDKKPF